MKAILSIIATFLFSANAFAWQGINLDTGTLIDIKIEDLNSFTAGNIQYFDYDLGELKLGYLSMYEQNFGLIVDLDTGDLLRIQVSPADTAAD